jgi:hypothetical protein
LSFHSRRRLVVFPQAEHARFAGALALVWADPPALPFTSFVRGVADHDRGYGELDDDPIGGDMSSGHWVAIQRRGFEPRGEDPVVDLVVALHVRRLLSSKDDEHERTAHAEVEALIPSLLEAAGVTREQAEAADAITNVCDVISFEFCFEEPAEREIRGHRVSLDGRDSIEIEPWPFILPRLVGLVTGFEADGYPERLVPVVTPFDASPARSRGA